MNRIVVISRCTDCPFYEFDNQTEPSKWGKHWCYKLNKALRKTKNADVGPIPDDCPLPVASRTP